jgi:hypothetical protein
MAIQRHKMSIIPLLFLFFSFIFFSISTLSVGSCPAARSLLRFHHLQPPPMSPSPTRLRSHRPGGHTAPNSLRLASPCARPSLCPRTEEPSPACARRGLVELPRQATRSRQGHRFRRALGHGQPTGSVPIPAPKPAPASSLTTPTRANVGLASLAGTELVEAPFSSFTRRQEAVRPSFSGIPSRSS